MKIGRYFTTAGNCAYENIEFALTSSEIKNPDGSIVFQLENVEVKKLMKRCPNTNGRIVHEHVRLENGRAIGSTSTECTFCTPQRRCRGEAGKWQAYREHLNRMHSLYSPERVQRRGWKMAGL